MDPEELIIGGLWYSGKSVIYVSYVIHKSNLLAASIVACSKKVKEVKDTVVDKLGGLGKDTFHRVCICRAVLIARLNRDVVGGDNPMMFVGLFFCGERVGLMSSEPVTFCACRGQVLMGYLLIILDKRSLGDVPGVQDVVKLRLEH
ncbi:hypothetical protein LOAG_06571 [Loa loa]|uniref:Uncharacterized protein n=1 Tax=Loa loa TaxID=7209 RepID=A0A1S0TZ79_LOALO|nr:hypothetical protein LOAG_06571 [Loa loa]EFO21915.1 hypothetical protein LOAG_06571 [Loa loa]